jgi:hypothetical protein
MSEANPKNVLAIEEEDRQQDLPRVEDEDKNVSKNAEANDVSESDHLLLHITKITFSAYFNKFRS